jgi:hypothetical protein
MTEQYGTPPSVVATPRKRGKGAIITGLVLLAVGIVMAIGGIVAFGASAASLLSGLGTSQTTPVEIPKTLEAGTTYAVYEQATSGTGSSSDPYIGSVQPGDVTVQATDGTAVIVTDSPSLSQTFSDGSKNYVVVATFDPPVSGQYVVSVKTDGATVIVAPSLTAVAKALPWLALIGLGALLALAGLIVFIVGIVRRSSKPAVAAGYPAAGYAPVPTPSPAARPTGLPAPGWYPDPERPGGQRYWNGTGWTESRT